MPFKIDLILPTKARLLFEGWIDHAFEAHFLNGNAFASGTIHGELGTLVTNAPMLLIERMPIERGDMVELGELMVRAAIDGDMIPYGQPNCLFFPNLRPIVAMSEFESEYLERYLFERWMRLIDPSHQDHETIIADLQAQPDSQSVPYIKQAIALKPQLEYLEYDDYGAYYKKCLWALQAIGTPEALQLIRDCTASPIPELRTRATYRLKRIAEIQRSR